MKLTVTRSSHARHSPPAPARLKTARAPQGPAAAGKAWLTQALVAGGLASILSTAMLAVRGKRDAGTAVATLNAPSHWLFGREALHANRPSWRHTLSGLLIHHGSSLFWGLLYSRLMHQPRGPAPMAESMTRPALCAIGITALAAWVDFRLVPKRLTPGFEHRLSDRSLVLVYGAFAAGLALGGWRMRERRSPGGHRPAHRSAGAIHQGPRFAGMGAGTNFQSAPTGEAAIVAANPAGTGSRPSPFTHSHRVKRTSS